MASGLTRGRERLCCNRGEGSCGGEVVAIAGFENKSTYSADKLWDTSGQLLTTSLLEMGTFRLVEWEKMKQLFDWKALSTNSLVKSPTSTAKARKILLCEYFLSGAVTASAGETCSSASRISTPSAIARVCCSIQACRPTVPPASVCTGPSPTR